MRNYQIMNLLGLIIIIGAILKKGNCAELENLQIPKITIEKLLESLTGDGKWAAIPICLVSVIYPSSPSTN